MESVSDFFDKRLKVAVLSILTWVSSSSEFASAESAAPLLERRTGAISWVREIPAILVEEPPQWEFRGGHFFVTCEQSGVSPSLRAQRLFQDVRRHG
jgi:hypothetical protein